MARRPNILPKWASTQYGGYGVEWDRAVIQCRDVLYKWAAAKEPHQYNELSQRVDAIAWPEGPHTHEGQQMGMLLGHVSINELLENEDRPVISALVYGKEEGMPSYGFWSFVAELGVSVGSSEEQRLAFWTRELKRCFEAYGMANRSSGTARSDSQAAKPS